jgi:hypothetical protein
VIDEPSLDGQGLFSPRDRVTSLPGSVRVAAYEPSWSDSVFRTTSHEMPAEAIPAPAATPASGRAASDDDEFGGWRPVRRK